MKQLLLRNSKATLNLISWFGFFVIINYITSYDRTKLGLPTIVFKTSGILRTVKFPVMASSCQTQTFHLTI
ncbi:hypothetical protein BpHYR1_035004 [Brachionus plicatilis]|uniref:Uncharacterized protein n=1 Tax=Brachionus plicatilis TaxID=10195 RepID=A0A3M7P7G3_BRAPC|nr:hypothetical protein BpHYR1_035004 [Brachionus plicatilis]